MQRNIMLAITCLMLSAASFAQNQYFQRYDDSALLKKDNDALIYDFEAMVKQVEPAFSFNGLTTEVPNKFMPGMYLHKTNKIYHVTWQTGWPPMQHFLTQMADNADSAQAMGAMFFHGFFLPHEVGHALHYHTNAVPENRYDAEYEANVMAVLYWRKKGMDKELQQCLAMAKKALKKLNNPVPENEDIKAYFTRHYNELLRDPFKYGYFQFSQIVQILEDKTLPGFETYITRYQSR